MSLCASVWRRNRVTKWLEICLNVQLWIAPLSVNLSAVADIEDKNYYLVLLDL